VFARVIAELAGGSPEKWVTRAGRSLLAADEVPVDALISKLAPTTGDSGNSARRGPTLVNRDRPLRLIRAAAWNTMITVENRRLRVSRGSLLLIVSGLRDDRFMKYLPTFLEWRAF